MTKAIANRKKAAKMIEQALPAGQTIRYQDLGMDNILSAELPALRNNATPAERFKVEKLSHVLWHGEV